VRTLWLEGWEAGEAAEAKEIMIDAKFVEKSLRAEIWIAHSAAVASRAIAPDSHDAGFDEGYVTGLQRALLLMWIAQDDAPQENIRTGRPAEARGRSKEMRVAATASDQKHGAQNDSMRQ
jgi:hypothetical protein